MSLRNRLLLAAAGIVGVSLLTSGILSLFLVRSLEFDNAQIDLDRKAIAAQREVVHAECATPPAVQTAACPGGRIATGTVFEQRVNGLVPSVADRLLLLTPQNAVIYDTQNEDAYGTQMQLVRTRQLDQSTAFEGTVQLGGQPFIASAVGLGTRRNPLGANKLVLIQSTASINALAVQSLLPPFIEAGLLALAVAIGLALILSRAFARPLSELADAAEDIAAGNYSRRVGVTSADEIGVVGRSFNRMGEAVERARTLQRDFLANVSHELKTPLTSLIGFSQALVDGSIEKPAERKRAAEIIHEEAERVLRMAQELLELARVESGQLPLHPIEVDLRALLEQELEIVRPRAAERGLEIHLQVPADLRPVRADVERLHQVVANLLDNAVKYATPGDPVILAVENGVQNVEVTVSNGIGSNPPDTERIFDRFYRGDPSRPSAGGVGLGLSISRELAAALGGRLWAELEGRRLRLRLTLPAQAEPLALPFA
ncbi:MAG: HAMP domain-containing histidine kinase [Candidatus Dormibacteraeota bacterium]|nr:HAMP domain-containing histidine kinase [Candidatus Dormibacteraeota bacterium]